MFISCIGVSMVALPRRTGSKHPLFPYTDVEEPGKKKKKPFESKMKILILRLAPIISLLMLAGGIVFIVVLMTR
jgi:hypothetical protein